MKHILPVFLVACLSCVGCHAAAPPAQPAQPQLNAADQSAPDMPEEPSTKSAEAPDDHEAAPKSTRPATLPAFTWSKAPDLKSAPADGVFGSFNGVPAKLTEGKLERRHGEWSLELREEEGDLSVNIDLKGAPAANKTFKKAFASGDGFIQIPQKKNVAPTKFDDTTSLNSDNAYVLQIVDFDGKSDAKQKPWEQKGTATVKLVSVFDKLSDDEVPSWVAGTLKVKVQLDDAETTPKKKK